MSPVAMFTKNRITKIRIKYEVKFLYMKKGKLNKELYKTHLKLAHKWGKCWDPIRIPIIHSLNKEIEIKYKKVEEKPAKLAHTQDEKVVNPTKFHPGINNKTNITFSEEEITLLNKSLKYNLNFKQKKWIKNLALEAEAATTQLPILEQEYMRCRVAVNINKLYTLQSK